MLGGLLAGAGTFAAQLAVDVNADDKSLVVVWSVFADDLVQRSRGFAALGQFLQMRLGIHPGTAGQDLIKSTENACRDENPGRVITLVQVQRADDSFETIGQDLGAGPVSAAFLATAKPQQ